MLLRARFIDSRRATTGCGRSFAGASWVRGRRAHIGRQPADLQQAPSPHRLCTGPPAAGVHQTVISWPGRLVVAPHRQGGQAQVIDGRCGRCPGRPSSAELHRCGCHEDLDQAQPGRKLTRAGADGSRRTPAFPPARGCISPVTQAEPWPGPAPPGNHRAFRCRRSRQAGLRFLMSLLRQPVLRRVRPAAFVSQRAASGGACLSGAGRHRLQLRWAAACVAPVPEWRPNHAVTTGLLGRFMKPASTSRDRADDGEMSRTPVAGAISGSWAFEVGGCKAGCSFVRRRCQPSSRPGRRAG